MPTLREKISVLAEEMASQFAVRLAAVLRDAPVSEIAALEGSLRAARPATATPNPAPKQPVRSKPKKALPAPAVVAAEAKRSRKGAKRRAKRAKTGGKAKRASAPVAPKGSGPVGQTEKHVANIVAILKEHPEGMHSADLRKATNLDRNAWKTVIERARDERKVKVEGQRAAAVYSLLP
jgi:hypothetical protein